MFMILRVYRLNYNIILYFIGTYYFCIAINQLNIQILLDEFVTRSKLYSIVLCVACSLRFNLKHIIIIIINVKIKMNLLFNHVFIVNNTSCSISKHKCKTCNWNIRIIKIIIIDQYIVY